MHSSESDLRVVYDASYRFIGSPISVDKGLALNAEDR